MAVYWDDKETPYSCSVKSTSVYAYELYGIVSGQDVTHSLVLAILKVLVDVEQEDIVVKVVSESEFIIILSSVSTFG